MESVAPKETRQAREGAGKWPKEREYPQMKAQMGCKKNKIKKKNTGGRKEKQEYLWKKEGSGDYSAFYIKQFLYLNFTPPPKHFPKLLQGADSRAGSGLSPALSLLQSSSSNSSTES